MHSSVSERVTAGPYRADSVETQYAEVDGVSYAYRRLGPQSPVDPTPVVFLHRFRGNLDDWDPAFVDALAETRDVILFSDAGLGSSTGSPARSIEAKARNAAAFIRALGLTSVDVLGFSMGGFSAQEIALTEPDLVRKVVLIGSAAGGNPETDPPTDIVFEIALHPEYSFEDVRYLFFAEGRDQETQAYVDRVAVRKDREPVLGPEAIQALVECSLPFSSGESKHFDRLSELNQPVLIVSGDRDPFFPAKNQWLLFRELPNAQLAMYPQAGRAPTSSTPRPSPHRSSVSWPTADGARDYGRLHPERVAAADASINALDAKARADVVDSHCADLTTGCGRRRTHGTGRRWAPARNPGGPS